jgi:hypothetical protein
MSHRPSAAGRSPRSGRERRLSDSRASALTFCHQTLDTPLPAVAGQFLGRPPLAACRGHDWATPVNDSRPGWPNTARSQTSLACSLPGSAGVRRTSRAIARRQRPGGLAGHPINRACRDRSGLLAFADRPQAHIGAFGPAADALLDAEQHLNQPPAGSARAG